MFSEKCAKKYHVKKGDAVEVISGEWKKETGKIVAVLKKKDRVVLKKSAANPKGGLVDRAVSVLVSNVRKKD